MVNSILVLAPGQRIFNAAGLPASGAQIQFFQAGTTTPRVVYADSGLTQPLGSTVFTRADGFPVANQGSSTVVQVWTGTTPYKIQILDSSSSILYPVQDNISGALDTSVFLLVGNSSTLNTPVISPVVNTTLVAANKGQVVDAQTSGGSFTLTLDLAVNLANGWNIFIRNGGSNPLTVATSGGQLIAHPIASVTAFSLRQGEGFHISCNGATFRCDTYVPPLITPGTTGVIQITDIVTSAPGSPAAGARYIVGSAFSTFLTGDIIEASGVGTFFKITPPTNAGWLAYVQTQSSIYAFRGSAWALIFPGAITAGTGSPTQTIIFGAQPTVQRPPLGSGNYTPTPGTIRIRVRMCAGGGGGAAQTTNNGANGSDTSFGGWTAIHGSGATAGSGGVGGAGGTGGVNGTGTLIARFAGGQGNPSQTGSTGNTGIAGGSGGANPFGGAGPGGAGSSVGANQPGLSAAANTGAGGGGAGNFTTSPNGSSPGGGAGEYVEFYVNNPGVIAYVIGAGGAGGAAGGQAGGNGAGGVLIIEEFYS